MIKYHKKYFYSTRARTVLYCFLCTIRFWPLWFSNLLLLSLSMSTVYCLATSLCMLSYLLTELLMDLIVSSVVEFQSKLFGQKTICSKETIIFWNFWTISYSKTMPNFWRTDIHFCIHCIQKIKLVLLNKLIFGTHHLWNSTNELTLNGPTSDHQHSFQS